MNQADVPEWIDVSVAEVRRTDDVPHPKHLMLLHERGGHRRLAIWIGPAEATAMVISLESVEQPRPMPYSLTANLLVAAGSPVREVRITRLTPPIYYATVIVEAPNGRREVDARPSDAVNLALVAGVPIRADSRLFGDVQAEHYADGAAADVAAADVAAAGAVLDAGVLCPCATGADELPAAAQPQTPRTAVARPATPARTRNPSHLRPGTLALCR